MNKSDIRPFLLLVLAIILIAAAAVMSLLTHPLLILA